MIVAAFKAPLERTPCTVSWTEVLAEFVPAEPELELLSEVLDGRDLSQHLPNTVIDQSIEILRRRVDETGTLEPTLVRQGDERIAQLRPPMRRVAKRSMPAMP